MGDEERPRGRLYSTADVARLFGVVRETASRWAKAGRYGAFKTPGNRWRFSADQVDERLSRGEDP